MILSWENIHAGGTSGCGFNKDQLQLLGVQSPPKKGWLSRLIGKEISDENYQQFLLLKGRKSMKRKERRKHGENRWLLEPAKIIAPKCWNCAENPAYMDTGWCEPCLYLLVETQIE